MSPLVRRLGLWRLWRNRFGRWCYRLLQRLGFVAALMIRYEAGPAVDADRPSVPAAFELERWPADDPSISGEVPGSLEGTDVVVGATIDGELVGYGILSPRSVEVPEIGGVVEPDGVYLWDLYVDPAYRGRGLGTALLWRARIDAIAADTGTVEALVAADNEPSRRAFLSADFVPTERLLAVGWKGYTYQRTTQLGSAPEA